MTTLLQPPTAAPAATSPAPEPVLSPETLIGLVHEIAAVLPPVRRLGEFVGLNPMAGLEHLTFDAATYRSSSVLGGRRTPAESVMRAAHAAGRISADELMEALLTQAPHLATGTLTLGGTRHQIRDLVFDDLTAGPTDGAPARSRRTLSEALARPIAEQIDRRTSRWAAAYYDAGEASWPMPHRDRGLYGAWIALAAREPGMPRRLRRAVKQAPVEAATALLDALVTLGVPDREHAPYLEAHLGAMPGWAAYAHHVGAADTSELVDLLAIRVVQEAAMLGPGAWRPSLSASAPLSSQVPAEERAAALLHRLGRGTAHSRELAEVTALLASAPRRDLVWLAAYEQHYRDQVLATLDGDRPTREQRPDAQLVFCIDPRSEGLRRALDAADRFETHGFAGFFGLPMQLAHPDGRVIAQCPVPIPPTVTVAPATPATATPGQALRAAADAALHTAHTPGAGAFVFAEAAGVIAAPRSALRTSAPALQRTRPGALGAPLRAQNALPEELIDHAAGIVSSLGVRRPMAPLLVLCGHESTTANNPYGAALQCGACGGHSGESNARAVATLLNDPQVRDGLAARGVEIPTETLVVAAVHDTTTDEVRLLLDEVPPASHVAALDQLRRDLDAACAALRAERARSLPATAHSAPLARSADWAQPFPEWGLAGNAAMIVAPQSAVQGRDLARRTFLHTYHAAEDPEGSLLETILTAPMVVAHGLSAQYFGAAVDPQHLGSGTKAVHNVVGGIGVTAAAGGDLLIGLPWQSVADGDWLVHEPMRLLVLVEAPRERIDRILGDHASVANLIDGSWVHLLCREHAADDWQQRTAAGWQPVRTSPLDPSPTFQLKEPNHADR